MAEDRNSAAYAFTEVSQRSDLSSLGLHSSSTLPLLVGQMLGLGSLGFCRRLTLSRGESLLLIEGNKLIARYGMVAALCEEVKEPAREVPRAMVLSVAAAAITGLVYLVSCVYGYS